MKPTTATSFVWEYPGTVDRWIDGDTVVAHVRFSPGLEAHGVHVRLAGVNAPELSAADPEEREFARRAKSLVEAMAGPGSPIRLRCADVHDKYGRLVAEVFTRYDASVNDALASSGLVKGGTG